MKRRRGTHRASRDPEGSPERRDQKESAFASILGALLARLPVASAAAMVDSDGETVDYAGRGDPFAVRVTAAHWRIVLEQAGVWKSLHGLRWLAIRGANRSYVAYALPHGYALVITFSRAPGLVRWQRAVATCARALGQEAGWAPVGASGLAAATATVRRIARHQAQGRAQSQAEGAGWFPVEIVADERRRPRAVRIRGRLHELEILGTIVWHRGAADGQRVHRMAPTSQLGQSGEPGQPGETAWRVRLEKGIEATIVREPGGAWYADEPVDLLVRPE